MDARCQPLAIRDVLHYPMQCLAAPETPGQTLDLGGSGVLTYREPAKCWILPVPILTPRLSSLWIHLALEQGLRLVRSSGLVFRGMLKGIRRSAEAAPGRRSIQPRPLVRVPAPRT